MFETCNRFVAKPRNALLNNLLTHAAAREGD